MAERDPPRLRRGFDPFRPLHDDAGAMTSGSFKEAPAERVRRMPRCSQRNDCIATFAVLISRRKGAAGAQDFPGHHRNAV